MHNIFFRQMENIRGFTRETFIEITSDIESQEIRRIRNTDINNGMEVQGPYAYNTLLQFLAICS
jgi:hypothetical protein